MFRIPTDKDAESFADAFFNALEVKTKKIGPKSIDKENDLIEIVKSLQDQINQLQSENILLNSNLNKINAKLHSLEGILGTITPKFYGNII